MTNDLAALMSQKRDIELVESARKVVKRQNPHMLKRTMTFQIPNRSFSQ